MRYFAVFALRKQGICRNIHSSLSQKLETNLKKKRSIVFYKQTKIWNIKLDKTLEYTFYLLNGLCTRKVNLNYAQRIS